MLMNKKIFFTTVFLPIIHLTKPSARYDKWVLQRNQGILGRILFYIRLDLPPQVFPALMQVFGEFSIVWILSENLKSLKNIHWLNKILTVIFSRMAMLSFQSLGSQFSNSDPSSSKLSFTNELTCSLEGSFPVP